jgi:hypothetical protein
MATAEQYAAARAAVAAIAAADLAKDVPAMFRGDIPQDLVDQFVTDASKAAVDAVIPSS